MLGTESQSELSRGSCRRPRSTSAAFRLEGFDECSRQRMTIQRIMQAAGSRSNIRLEGNNRPRRDASGAEVTSCAVRNASRPVREYDSACSVGWNIGPGGDREPAVRIGRHGRAVRQSEPAIPVGNVPGVSWRKGRRDGGRGHGRCCLCRPEIGWRNGLGWRLA